MMISFLAWDDLLMSLTLICSFALLITVKSFRDPPTIYVSCVELHDLCELL